MDKFNKDNKKIAVGWLLADNVNTLVTGFSQNLLEYYYVVVDKYNAQQYIHNDIEVMVEQSKLDGFEQILIIKQGIVFTNIDEYFNSVNSTAPMIIAGGDTILDFNKATPDMFSHLILRILNTQVTFVANTDNPNIAEHYMPDLGDIQFTKLVTSAGGLNPILYPWSLGMEASCTVEVRDVSNIALINAKRWVTEWDGIDSKTFSLMLKNASTIDGDTIQTRGYKMADQMQAQVDNQLGFKDWHADAFKHIGYSYHIHDFFNPTDNARLLDSIQSNVGNVYVHLSNIYHYQATAFYFGLNARVSMRNELLNSIKSRNLGSKVMITLMDPQMNQPPKAMWVDDIEIQEVLPKFKVFPWQL